MTDEPIGIRLCTTLFMLIGFVNLVAGMALMAGIDVFHLVETSEFEVLPKIFSTSSIIGLLSLIYGVAGLAIAYGMLNLKKWARIGGIILAVIGLINIPIGTIISIVILYFLLIDKNTKDLFIE